MKYLIKFIGVCMGLFAAALIADRSFRFARDNTRNYITHSTRK